MLSQFTVQLWTLAAHRSLLIANTAITACLAVRHMTMTSHLCTCTTLALAGTVPKHARTHPLSLSLSLSMVWGLIPDLEKLCTAVLGTVTTAMGLT